MCDLGKNSVTYNNLSVGSHKIRITAKCPGGRARKIRNISFEIRN